MWNAVMSTYRSIKAEIIIMHCLSKSSYESCMKVMVCIKPFEMREVELPTIARSDLA